MEAPGIDGFLCDMSYRRPGQSKRKPQVLIHLNTYLRLPGLSAGFFVFEVTAKLARQSG